MAERTAPPDISARDGLKFYNASEGEVLIGDFKRVFLRTEVNMLTLQFYYSLYGREFKKIGSLLDCSCLSDEAYGEIGHEGHTGTFVAMACQDLSGLNTHADFKSFTYEGDEV